MIFCDDRVKIKDSVQWFVVRVGEKEMNGCTDERQQRNKIHDKRNGNQRNERKIFIVYSLWIPKSHTLINPYNWMNTKIEFKLRPTVFTLKMCLFHFDFNIFISIHSPAFAVWHLVRMFASTCISFITTLMCLIYIALTCVSFPLLFSLQLLRWVCRFLCVRCAIKLEKWISTASKWPCLKTFKIASQWIST